MVQRSGQGTALLSEDESHLGRLCAFHGPIVQVPEALSMALLLPEMSMLDCQNT